MRCVHPRRPIADSSSSSSLEPLRAAAVPAPAPALLERSCAGTMGLDARLRSSPAAAVPVPGPAAATPCLTALLAEAAAAGSLRRGAERPSALPLLAVARLLPEPVGASLLAEAVGVPAAAAPSSLLQTCINVKGAAGQPSSKIPLRPRQALSDADTHSQGHHSA